MGAVPARDGVICRRYHQQACPRDTSRLSPQWSLPGAPCLSPCRTGLWLWVHAFSGQWDAYWQRHWRRRADHGTLCMLSLFHV